MIKCPLGQALEEEGDVLAEIKELRTTLPVGRTF
jgi:hypothetical protein